MIAFSNAFSNNPAQKHQYFVQKKYDNSESILSINYSDVNSRLHETVSDRKMADLGNLGTITNFNSVSDRKEEENFVNRQSARSSNFSLVNSAKKLLAITPQKRICVCMAHRAKRDENIYIKHNGKSGTAGRANFSNVVLCSAIHTCIVCNNRIMSKRSVEVAQGYDYFTNELGGFVPMLTLTIPHYKGGSLVEQLELINLAYKRLMGDRIMRKVWELLGKVGSIKAVEYTHGDNGHHNHIHTHIYIKKSHEDVRLAITRWTTPKKKGQLRLLDEKQEQDHISKGLQHKITYQTVEEFIKFYWVKLCRDVGLGIASLGRGAVFTTGEKVKSYLAKHKSAQEITNSRDKKAKNGNRNQWELLLDYQNGDREAGDIFKEYASAFSGGQLLQWSKGLKALVLIKEVEDEDIKGTEEEDSVEPQILEEITPDVWHIVKRYNEQANLLSAVENDYKNNTTHEYKNAIEKMISNHIEKMRRKHISEQKRTEKLSPPKWFNEHHLVS